MKKALSFLGLMKPHIGKKGLVRVVGELLEVKNGRIREMLGGHTNWEDCTSYRIFLYESYRCLEKRLGRGLRNFPLLCTPM